MSYKKDIDEQDLAEILENFQKDPMTNFLHVVLYFLIAIGLCKKLFQIGFVDQLAFFSSAQNIAEVITYVTDFLGIVSNDLDDKPNLCSCTVLLSFLVFSFLIQKLRMFGLYVLAFRRTLTNSSKFMPIFFLIFMGFNIAYRLRIHFGVSYFNTDYGTTVLRTLSMALGELDSDKMGLEVGSIINIVFYALFIFFMCIITFNLLVGKAIFF